MRDLRESDEKADLKKKIMEMNDKAVQAFNLDKIELCHSIFKKIEEMLEGSADDVDKTCMIIILYNLACTTQR